MQRVSDIAWNATRTGGTISAMIDGTTTESADMTTRLAEMQDALDQREASLKAQFTAMETTLSELKGQSGALGGIAAPADSSSSAGSSG
jgi:flagellar capping protein FliD